MEYKTKENIINSLAQEFSKTKNNDVALNTNNYIGNTGTLDCSVHSLDVDTLKKTKNVIEMFENKYKNAEKTQDNTQLLAHMRVAKKCVEEIIVMKMKEESKL